MCPIITANSIVHSFCQLLAIKHTFNCFHKAFNMQCTKQGHDTHTAEHSCPAVTVKIRVAGGAGRGGVAVDSIVLFQIHHYYQHSGPISRL